MKLKLLTWGLLVTSLFGYLEWGGDNSAFLYQMELEILKKLITSPSEAAHPFTILPLIGQLLLLVTLFLQWRIIFTWRGNDVFDVEIVDYHD